MTVLTKKLKLCSLLTLCICVAGSAYAEDRVSAFNSDGSNKVTRQGSTAEKMPNVVVHGGEVNCQDVAEKVAATEERESVARQTVTDQVTGAIDFNPLINCQKIGSDIAAQIASSGGSFGLIGGVLAQLGASAACSFRPISRGISTYNGYAKGASTAYKGYQAGSVSQTVRGATTIGSKSGVISGGTSGTINKTTSAGQQVYTGYNAGDVKQTSKGSQVIINSGSKYLSGAQ